MRDDLECILFSEEELQKRIREMGAEISRDYQGRAPLFVGILKGCFVFMADLVRQVTVPCTMDFMAVSSYGDSTTTSGTVKITKDLREDIQGRDVVIVEDILDTGVTLHSLTGLLRERKPASLSIAALLDKPARRQAEIHAKYTGFQIPDGFVVGCGLDYAEKYRNLPCIGILKPEIYTK